MVIPFKAPKVFVAGEVNDAGAVPFSNGYAVSDYIVAARGINPDSGTPNRIFFVDESGGRQRVSLETSVDIDLRGEEQLGDHREVDHPHPYCYRIHQRYRGYCQ